eukprot:gene55124-55103_t
MERLGQRSCIEGANCDGEGGRLVNDDATSKNASANLGEPSVERACVPVPTVRISQLSVAEEWAISRKDRNHDAHCDNGNGDPPNYVPDYSPAAAPLAAQRAEQQLKPIVRKELVLGCFRAAGVQQHAEHVTNALIHRQRPEVDRLLAAGRAQAQGRLPREQLARDFLELAMIHGHGTGENKIHHLEDVRAQMDGEPTQAPASTRAQRAKEWRAPTLEVVKEWCVPENKRIDVGIVSSLQQHEHFGRIRAAADIVRMTTELEDINKLNKEYICGDGEMMVEGCMTGKFKATYSEHGPLTLKLLQKREPGAGPAVRPGDELAGKFAFDVFDFADPDLAEKKTRGEGRCIALWEGNAAKRLMVVAYTADHDWQDMSCQLNTYQARFDQKRMPMMMLKLPHPESLQDKRYREELEEKLCMLAGYAGLRDPYWALWESVDHAAAAEKAIRARELHGVAVYSGTEPPDPKYARVGMPPLEEGDAGKQRSTLMMLWMAIDMFVQVFSLVVAAAAARAGRPYLALGCSIFAILWAVSRKERNRRMHALIGNRCAQSSFGGAARLPRAPPRFPSDERATWRAQKLFAAFLLLVFVVWAISAVDRNREMHALNGNMGDAQRGKVREQRKRLVADMLMEHCGDNCSGEHVYNRLASHKDTEEKLIRIIEGPWGEDAKAARPQQKEMAARIMELAATNDVRVWRAPAGVQQQAHGPPPAGGRGRGRGAGRGDRPGDDGEAEGGDRGAARGRRGRRRAERPAPQPAVDVPPPARLDATDWDVPVVDKVDLLKATADGICLCSLDQLPQVYDDLQNCTARVAVILSEVPWDDRYKERMQEIAVPMHRGDGRITFDTKWLLQLGRGGNVARRQQLAKVRIRSETRTCYLEVWEEHQGRDASWPPFGYDRADSRPATRQIREALMRALGDDARHEQIVDVYNHAMSDGARGTRRFSVATRVADEAVLDRLLAGSLVLGAGTMLKPPWKESKQDNYPLVKPSRGQELWTDTDARRKAGRLDLPGLFRGIAYNGYDGVNIRTTKEGLPEVRRALLPTDPASLAMDSDEPKLKRYEVCGGPLDTDAAALLGALTEAVEGWTPWAGRVIYRSSWKVGEGDGARRHWRIDAESPPPGSGLTLADRHDREFEVRIIEARERPPARYGVAAAGGLSGGKWGAQPQIRDPPPRGPWVPRPWAAVARGAAARPPRPPPPPQQQQRDGGAAAAAPAAPAGGATALVVPPAAAVAAGGGPAPAGDMFAQIQAMFERELHPVQRQLGALAGLPEQIADVRRQQQEAGTAAEELAGKVEGNAADTKQLTADLREMRLRMLELERAARDQEPLSR